MWPIRRKPGLSLSKKSKRINEKSDTIFDMSVLRQNNITRLSIDERWTKLFASLKMSPEIERGEREMNELIKKEAILKNEQENLEPQKRKYMDEIISLTQEAFENDNKEAKERLKECRKEIEKINKRINDIVEDIESVEQELKETNLRLLEDSVLYIFSTLRKRKDRAQEINNELILLEQREKALREELETISLDWTNYAIDLTKLIGADHVKRLEEKFGLEGLKSEAADSTTDENSR